MKKPPLELVPKPDASVPKPPRKLGVLALSVWQRILSEYVIDDAAGLELLYQACCACERIERMRAQIEANGEMIRVGQVYREHPLLKAELANRAYVTRAFAKLGLAPDSLRSPGRPPGSGA
jgi:phage terminase small subunit